MKLLAVILAMITGGCVALNWLCYFTKTPSTLANTIWITLMGSVCTYYLLKALL
jgi:hypothetical protein